MKIQIKRDALVCFGAGSVIEVPDEEGRRLISLNNAAEIKEEPKKETKKKKAAK